MPRSTIANSVTTARERIENTMSEEKLLEEVSNICNICRKEIRKMDDKFEASDLWNHYTLCYIAEGKFSRVLSDAGGSLTEKRERKYLCPDRCNGRGMYAREYAMHMGVRHMVTQQIMARDRRAGMEEIFRVCYPHSTRDTGAEVKKETQSPPPPPPSQTYSQNPPPRKRIKESKNPPPPPAKISPPTTVYFSTPGNTLTQQEEEESVDDPEALPCPPPAKRVQCEPVEAKEAARSSSTIVRNCPVCKSDKLSFSVGNRNDFRGSMFHISHCFFKQHRYKGIISPGPDNVDDNLGTKFLYRCPIQTCPENSSKTRSSAMSFAAYCNHCAVNHGQLEVALEREASPDTEQVREAVLRHRELKDPREILVEEMPEALIEEIHDCYICKDEPGKSGKKISLTKGIIESHYKQCYLKYDIEKIIDKYPPGPKNLDQATGKVKDEVGRIARYSCDVRGCKEKNVGYRTYVLHKLVEHGGLRALMETDTRPGADYVFGKMEKLLSFSR